MQPAGSFYDPLFVLRVLRFHRDVTWGLPAVTVLVSGQLLRHSLQSLTVRVQVQGRHSLALTSGKLLDLYASVSSS